MRVKSVILSTILVGVVGFAQNISINDRWQLLGATENINISNFNNSCAKLIWKFDSSDSNHPWKLFAADGGDYGYPFTMTSINEGEGFWVLGKPGTSCDINASSTQQNTFDARHLGGITVYEVYFDNDGTKSIGKLEFLDNETVKYTGIEGEDAGDSATIKFTATQNSITTVSIDGNTNLSDEDASTTTFTQISGKPYFLKSFWEARNGDTDTNYYFHTLSEAQAFTQSQLAELVPTKTIASPADWDHVSAIYTDPVGDASPSGLDIVKIKMTQDNNNLYINLERAGLQFPSSDYYYNYWIYFRAGDKTFSIENFHDNQGNYSFRVYRGIGYDGGTEVLNQNKTPNTSNKNLQIVVPKSLNLIGEDMTYSVSIFTHRFKGSDNITGEKEADSAFMIKFQ